ncbi:MAG: PHP domain-containing protein [Planctomycetes bacterium]|nr:PHP domain-containing protein [Planctomycetota bacterium]
MNRAQSTNLLLSASFAVLAGCSSVTTMFSTPGVHPAERPLRVAGTSLFDWKGVVHCHSHLSHDCEGTIEEISAACDEADMDFVVMTDHQTDESIREGVRGFVGNTLFVLGAEVRSPQGTLLAFPLTKPLRHWQHPGLLAKEALAQGGLAFVCHAELWKIGWNVPGLAGAEIVNLHAGAMTEGYLGTLGTVVFLPLRSLFERLCLRDSRVLDAWDNHLQRQHPFTPIGGNDAHANLRVYGALGGTIGTYREVFLTLSTHVLAERLDEPSLVEAFRLGRTYVSFDVFGEGAGFDFRAEDRGVVSIGGATVAASPALRLAVRTPQAGHIVLLRDGKPIREVDGDSLELTSPPPGIYRTEVSTSGGQPWLFSSTIRVLP